MEYTWLLMTSGNPNKSWICDKTGRKLSSLMSTRAARELCQNHNMAINYLTEKQRATEGA